MSSPSSSSFTEENPVSLLWGCELNDTTRKCVLKEEDDLLEHLLYLRTVSLGEDADDETHVVAVESRNMASVPKPLPIVSLKHSVLPMVCLDGFELLPPVSFTLKSGTGPVYLNGQYLILDDESEYDPTEELDDDENSFDDEEDISVPGPEMQAIPSPEMQAVPGPEMQAVPGPEMQAVPGPEMQAVPGPEMQAVPGPEMQAVPGPEMQAVPGPEMQAVPGPVMQAVPRPMMQAVSGPEMQAEKTSNQVS